MGTCDSGPGQRDQRSADCYALCREVTMLAPVAVTTRWCGRCPGLFHQIPAPSSTPRIGSVVAMSGRMWKAPCRRKGRNIYISRPDLLHTHATLPSCWSPPADVMRVHCRALSRECHCRSLRRPATYGVRWVGSCRASQPPQSIIGALLIPHNHWTIVIMTYRLIGADSMWHSRLSDRGVLARRGPVAKWLDTSAPLCSPNRHFILDKPPGSRWNPIETLTKELSSQDQPLPARWMVTYFNELYEAWGPRDSTVPASSQGPLACLWQLTVTITGFNACIVTWLSK